MNIISITFDRLPAIKKVTNYRKKDSWLAKKLNSDFYDFKNMIQVRFRKELFEIQKFSKEKNSYFSVEVIIYKSLPKSITKKMKKIYDDTPPCERFCNTKPDIDNLQKGLFDAIFIDCDQKISVLKMTKLWGEKDKTEVIINLKTTI